MIGVGLNSNHTVRGMLHHLHLFFGSAFYLQGFEHAKEFYESHR